MEGKSKMFVFNKSVENDYEKLQKEIAQLEIENKRLLFENQDLREKLKCESKTKEEFILTHGEYIIGEDIRPGRYSFKVIQGDDGMVETTGRDWKIIGIGNDFNQVMKYQNLSLKINTKLKIRGNIKLLFKREKPINIDDDMSLLEIKNKEIEKLKAELKDLKKKYEELKLQLNEKTFEDEYILKYGYYYGGENIALGIYDLKVLSGSGYVKERGNFHQMGNTQYGKMEMFGLKISNKTKIQLVLFYPHMQEDIHNLDLLCRL